MVEFLLLMSDQRGRADLRVLLKRQRLAEYLRAAPGDKLTRLGYFHPLPAVRQRTKEFPAIAPLVDGIVDRTLKSFTFNGEIRDALVRVAEHGEEEAGKVVQAHDRLRALSRRYTGGIVNIEFAGATLIAGGIFFAISFTPLTTAIGIGAGGIAMGALLFRQRRLANRINSEINKFLEEVAAFFRTDENCNKVADALEALPR